MGVLLYPSLNIRRKQYWLEWSLCESMWAIPTKFTTVISRDVQRDLQPPEWLYALTGARSTQVQNYLVHHVPASFLTWTASSDTASGHIPLGLHTPFKSIVLLFCHDKN